MTCRHARDPPPDAGAASLRWTCRIVETATGERVDALLFVRAELAAKVRALPAPP